MFLFHMRKYGIHLQSDEITHHLTCQLNLMVIKIFWETTSSGWMINWILIVVHGLMMLIAGRTKYLHIHPSERINDASFWPAPLRISRKVLSSLWLKETCMHEESSHLFWLLVLTLKATVSVLDLFSRSNLPTHTCNSVARSVKLSLQKAASRSDYGRYSNPDLVDFERKLDFVLGGESQKTLGLELRRIAS